MCVVSGARVCMHVVCVCVTQPSTPLLLDYWCLLPLQLSSNDTVQDVKQIVYDRQETSYRTSLSAQFEGKKLEDYLDLSSVEGLQNNSVIKFIEGLHPLHVCGRINEPLPA